MATPTDRRDRRPRAHRRVEIRNGAAPVEIYRPYGADDLGERLRVIWSGAEYRGRGRQPMARTRLFSGREVAKSPRSTPGTRNACWNGGRRTRWCGTP